MTPTRVIARPLLAGIFVYGGIDALRHPEGKAPKAEDVGPAIAEPLGLPTDPVTLVRINGAVQVVGGTLLAMGKLPRLASLALAGSLVPTTYAGHRFWEEDDAGTKSQQQIHFLKNAAIVGGLILAATDTEGRPSMSWRARRALKRTRKVATVGKAATHTAHAAHDAAEVLAPIAAHLADEALVRGRRAKKKAAKAQKEASKRATKASKRATKRAKRASKGAKVAMTAVAVATPRAAERARSLASKAEQVVADQSRGAARQARDVIDSRLAGNGALDRARQKLPLAS